MSHAGSAKRSPSKYLSLSRRQRIRFWTNRALVLCPRTIVLPPAVVTSDAIGTGSCICEQSTLRQYVFASARSEEHTSELQSLMRISYAVFCLKKKTETTQ